MKCEVSQILKIDMKIGKAVIFIENICGTVVAKAIGIFLAEEIDISGAERIDNLPYNQTMSKHIAAKEASLDSHPHP